MRRGADTVSRSVASGVLLPSAVKHPGLSTEPPARDLEHDLADPGVAARSAPARSGQRRAGIGGGWFATCGALALICACSSGGKYGFSRTYSPLDAEERAAQGSETYDPVMARRLPGEWHAKQVNAFGVVLARNEGRDGLTDLTLSLRRLAARNLCDSGDENSCRVTVSDQELGRLHALVRLEQSDTVGSERVQPRSLVRVVGKLEDQPSKEDGSDVLVASYYRHFPAAYYVTDQARSYMRR